MEALYTYPCPLTSQPTKSFHKPKGHIVCNSTKREFAISFVSLSIALRACPNAIANTVVDTQPSSTKSTIISGIVNTKSWFQFFGGGFAIRVPPQFQDIMEPEDYSAGMSLYGDKAKPKTFAARFASSDGSEVLSVVVRPSNQLKITFLEAKDVTDFGTLKEAAKIFVPVNATIYSARAIKVKEAEGLRTYYYYEFGNDEQHIALVAAINSGKAWVNLLTISSMITSLYCWSNCTTV